MSPMAASSIDYGDPTGLSSRMKQLGNVALEPAGIYKFALEFFGISLQERFDPKLATSANMASVSRWFYDLGIGGALGQTEYPRRFLLSDYGNASYRRSQINGLINNMPSWLPGSRSEIAV